MDDPSVYAKRSFPLSTVNTRQMPSRVTTSSASRHDICRRGNPTNPAEHIIRKWKQFGRTSFGLVPDGRKTCTGRSVHTSTVVLQVQFHVTPAPTNQRKWYMYEMSYASKNRHTRINNYHNNVLASKLLIGKCRTSPNLTPA